MFLPGPSPSVPPCHRHHLLPLHRCQCHLWQVARSPAASLKPFLVTRAAPKPGSGAGRWPGPLPCWCWAQRGLPWPLLAACPIPGMGAVWRWWLWQGRRGLGCPHIAVDGCWGGWHGFGCWAAHQPGDEELGPGQQELGVPHPCSDFFFFWGVTFSFAHHRKATCPRRVMVIGLRGMLIRC